MYYIIYYCEILVGIKTIISAATVAKDTLRISRDRAVALRTFLRTRGGVVGAEPWILVDPLTFDGEGGVVESFPLAFSCDSFERSDNFLTNYNEIEEDENMLFVRNECDQCEQYDSKNWTSL